MRELIHLQQLHSSNTVRMLRVPHGIRLTMIKPYKKPKAECCTWDAHAWVDVTCRTGDIYRMPSHWLTDNTTVEPANRRARRQSCLILWEVCRVYSRLISGVRGGSSRGSSSSSSCLHGRRGNRGTIQATCLRQHENIRQSRKFAAEWKMFNSERCGAEE